MSFRRNVEVFAACTLLSASALLTSCGQEPAPEEKAAAAQLFARGCGLMAESRFADAQVRFDSARTSDPQEACYWVAAGQSRMNQANYDTARTFFEKAVGLDSTLREGWFALGFLALRQARNEDAVEALNHCLEDAGALYLAGTAYSRMERVAEAEDRFARAIKADPQFISAHYAFAQLLQRNGEEGRAEPLQQRFAYLKEHGGTSLDLGGDIGTHKQGRLADIPVPARFFSDFAPDRGSMTVSLSTAALVHSSGSSTREWVGARSVDLDGDGNDELLLVAEHALTLWRVEVTPAGVALKEITAGSGFPEVNPAEGVLRGVAVGGAGRDGAKDLLVLQAGRSSLWLRETQRGGFVESRVRLPGARAATWVDIDHDADLDLVLLPETAVSPGRPRIEVWGNSGAGGFADVTDSCGFSAARMDEIFPAAGSVTGVHAADFDRDWDTDLLLTFSGSSPAWVRNQHDGRFLRSDAGLDVVQIGSAGGGVARVGDAIGDGWFDAVFAGGDGIAVHTPAFGGKETAAATLFPVSGDGGTRRIALEDIDLDGDLDVIGWGPSGQKNAGIAVFENRGSATWQEVMLGTTGAAQPPSDVVALEPLCYGVPEKLGILVLPRRGLPSILRAQPKGRLLRMALDGGRSTREGFGAVIEVAQGRRWQRRFLADGASGQSGGKLTIGLPDSSAPDMVRLTWTSGIRQAVSDSALRASRGSLVVLEKPGETSSCPFVYTWNGERFEFIADALGGGVIGVVVDPPSTYHQPDPDEYIRISDSQFRAENGRLRMRIAEVLNEASIIDQVILYAVTRRVGEELYTNERMNMAEAPPAFGLWRIRNARPICRGETDGGVDVTPLLSELDRRFVSPGPQLPYAGFGVPHSLVLDLGPQPPGKPVVLVMDGWTSFWNSSSIAEAARDGVGFVVARIEVREAGSWRTVVRDMGIPAGKPKTIVVDLTGKLPRTTNEIRIVTNMLVYWDRARVTNDAVLEKSPRSLKPLSVLSSELRRAGYPAAVTPDGIEPYEYDYARQGEKSPWTTLPGNYTRYGEVGPLIGEADDRYVVMNHGDEIALEFQSAPVVDGMETDYFLYLFGYMKEMVARDSLLSQLEPLPFREMRYPYTGPSPLFRDDAYREYLTTYQTRRIDSRN